MKPSRSLVDLGTVSSREIGVLEVTLRRCVDKVMAFRRRRETIRTLHGLGDHLLADVGLHRYQITATVDRFTGRPLPGDPTAAHGVHGNLLLPDAVAGWQCSDAADISGTRYGFAEIPGPGMSAVKETPA